MAKNKSKSAVGGIPVHRVGSQQEFSKINNELRQRGFVALDALKPGLVKSIDLLQGDAAQAGAQDMATTMRGGAWCSGPIKAVAWDFDDRSNNTVQAVTGKDGKPLGLGYVRWGAGDNIPSTIPPLAMALPYTAAPLRYIADLTAGLGPRLMYRFSDGTLCEYRDAGARLQEELDAAIQNSKFKNQDDGLDDGMGFEEPPNPFSPLNPLSPSSQDPAVKRAQEAYDEWERTWYGEDITEEDGTKTHIPGAKEFLENNNLDLHLSQCTQDDVMLDICFPTVGLQRGRRGAWDPKIVSVSMLPCHSVRFEKMNEYRHINHCYFSDSWRTKGVGTQVANPESVGYTMYPAAMPQSLLSDLRYIVESNQRTRIKERPTWVVCPTFYPSLNKPYYPQPAWWSVFTSKAFDFSSTILYDKAKQRENSTTFSKIFFISLDYLDMVAARKGIAGDEEKIQEFVNKLDNDLEQFLQRRENNGMTMRQFKWQDPHTGKEVYNVEIVDVAETTNDAVKAGKEELELSTSPIFLALQVDPRLVGVPMVHSSNGGTALREMHLLKQQQLSVKQRLLLAFYNAIPRFNGWDEHMEAHIVQQTLTTLDNSKTGLVNTVASEGA